VLLFCFISVLVVVVVVVLDPGLFFPALPPLKVVFWYEISSTVPPTGPPNLSWITTAGFLFFKSLVS